LSLGGNAVINLGTGISTLLNFADSSAVAWATPATLSIYNWTGNTSAPGSNDPDQIFVGSGLTALTAQQLSQVLFYSDAGSTLIGHGTLLGTGQLVPEPSSWMLAASLLGLCGLRGRRLGRALAARNRA